MAAVSSFDPRGSAGYQAPQRHAGELPSEAWAKYARSTREVRAKYARSTRYIPVPSLAWLWRGRSQAAETLKKTLNQET